MWRGPPPTHREPGNGRPSAALRTAAPGKTCALTINRRGPRPFFIECFAPRSDRTPGMPISDRTPPTKHTARAPPRQLNASVPAPQARQGIFERRILNKKHPTPKDEVNGNGPPPTAFPHRQTILYRKEGLVHASPRSFLRAVLMLATKIAMTSLHSAMRGAIRLDSESMDFRWIRRSQTRVSRSSFRATFNLWMKSVRDSALWASA